MSNPSTSLSGLFNGTPTATTPPRLWLMLGNRTGDNNQLFALAEALGLPFEVKPMQYNQWRRLRFLRGPRLVSLTRASRELIKPPWPDLIIGAGYGSVPIARYVRQQNGGRTKLVQFGNPRTSIADIDLVITTPQYSRAPAPNVLPLPFPVGDPAKAAEPSAEERRWLAHFPRPIRLVVIGGPTRNWEIDRDELLGGLELVAEKAGGGNGSVIIVTSPRTPRSLDRWLHRWAGPRQIPIVQEFPRFAALLAECDEFFVTADSVSMLSEAIFTRKPVAIIPIRKSVRGRLSYLLSRLGLKPWPRMDLPKFWELLEREQLVGPASAPVTSAAADTIGIAVKAVERLFDDAPGPIAAPPPSVPAKSAMSRLQVERT